MSSLRLGRDEWLTGLTDKFETAQHQRLGSVLLCRAAQALFQGFFGTPPMLPCAHTMERVPFCSLIGLTITLADMQTKLWLASVSHYTL